MNDILYVFIAFLSAKLAAEIILGFINRRHVLANKGPVPAAFQAFMDQPTYDKSVRYTLAKNTLALIENVFDAVILAFIVLSGILPYLYETLSGLLGDSLWAQGSTLIIIGIILSLPSLPLEYYAQFHLEERFGFNRSTLALWITDKLKALVLTFVIGLPLLAALLKFYYMYPYSWWLYAFTLVFLFQILMLILYPMFILPWFNKLSPLEDEELRKRLLDLAYRTGFKASTIQVIDGSKRSTHSNAYFTGFGRFRRIVLFDTLIDELTPEELEAVLAHEIGHYKRGHIPKMITISAFSTLAMFGVVAFLIHQPWFYLAFGFPEDAGIVPALLLLLLIAGLFTFWITPLTNALSRKFEFEADSFARDALKSQIPLIAALRKLHQKNLANLTPHPLFSRFYYSHPTLIERENALNADSQ